MAPNLCFDDVYGNLSGYEIGFELFGDDEVVDLLLLVVSLISHFHDLCLNI